MDETINNSINQNAQQSQYNVGPVQFHTHNVTDSPQVDISNIGRFPTTATDGQVPQFSTAKNQWLAATILGTGTVTNVSGVNNGFQWTIANSTTTPTITLNLDGTGIVYGLNVSGAYNPSLVALPNDATQFLNGASPTPAYAQVTDADLSTSDITTNNVSTSKHGFIPKAPNNTALFFRGDATYAALPSGNVTYSNGVTTYAMNTASGTQTIAHGLGKTPSKVDLIGFFYSFGTQTTWWCRSDGTFSASGNNSVYAGFSGSYFMSNSSTYGIFLTDSGGDTQEGIITVDSTNIYIAWTKVGGPPSTAAQILWKAEG